MSEERYYELLADPEATSRWYLKSPLDSDDNEVDPRTFTQGVPVNILQSLRLPLRRAGDRVDFNFCDFDMIVTPSDLNSGLESLVGPAIQRIPIAIEDQNEMFEILNVCKRIECVDESRSLATKWTAENGRPEKIGQYRMIVSLKIDASAAKGHDIFRVSGWPIAVIVSERVKRFFESRKVSGLNYERVD
jgi:hypothetical protein